MAVFGVFFTLELTEIFLAIGNFASSPGLGSRSAVTSASITALVAWYTSAAGVSGGMGGRIRLPVGKPLHLLAALDPRDVLPMRRDQVPRERPIPLGRSAA